METFPVPIPLLIAWAVVTVVLIAMVIYRGILAKGENDALLLDTAEHHMEEERNQLIHRIEALSRPITALGVTCGVLLLLIAGIFIWRGIQQNF